MPLPDAPYRTITAPNPGGAEVLAVEHRAPIPPGPGQVGVHVAAAGVNRPDILQRQGLYPAPAGASDGLGLEVSGEIAAVGPGVTGWTEGEAVCALLNGGGYADYAVAEAGALLPAPQGVSLRDAAAFPEAVFTVWANVFEAGGLRPGETVLIHGGTSGIGVMAIQMAKAHGATVFATAGTEEKCALCSALGADLAVNYREHDFAAAVKSAGGADVILDMVGGDYVARNLSVLKQAGRLVQIAFQQGADVRVDLMRLMLKRLTLTGSVLRSRPNAEKARLAKAVRGAVWPWIEAGAVRPVIDQAFALEEASAAHARMEAGLHAGKILLIP